MEKLQNAIKAGLYLRILFLLFVFTQTNAFAQKGQIIREVVHGKSLENTITKENPKRNVSIYLPPSYKSSKNKRYPTIYLLHGIGDTDRVWTDRDDEDNDGYFSIQDMMDKGIAEGKFGEMIIVMPDEKTNWFGSWYANSSVTGNWEDWTVKELVSFIDNKYRTLTDSKHRGIGGHSMGGAGSITLGMKHPNVFSVVYGMNPAILGWAGELTIENPSFALVAQAKTYDELMKELMKGNVIPAGTITVSQGIAPNPNKPPFYCDLPFKMQNGKLFPNEPGFSKWEEMFPKNLVKKYRLNLKKLRGLRFDSGYEDEYRFIPPNSRKLSSELTNNGIEHIFEEYNGDHNNRKRGKRGRMMTEVLPYFWDLLKPKNN